MDSGITPIAAAQEAQQEAKAHAEGYFLRVLIGLDQFANTILGGHPDETISARSARAATEGKLWGKILSHCLDVFQSDHGAKAEAGDLERADIVQYLEDNGGALPK